MKMSTHQLAIGYSHKGNGSQLGGAMDLTLSPGEFVCLLGPNGIGKSTLIRTLAGLQKPLSGNIWMDGQNIKHISRQELAKKVSLVLTESIPGLQICVSELLLLGRSPYLGWLGVEAETDKTIVYQAAQSTGITHLLKKKLYELSDGERQKVMVTRALVQDTRFILLDEPTAHLDLPNRIELMELLRDLAIRTQKAILLSTHDLELALQMADTVWLMSGHPSVVQGPPEELVMKGFISKAFSRGSVMFDQQLGTFKSTSFGPTRAVRLLGQGLAFAWTHKALKRKGFHYDGQAKTTVEVTELHGHIQYNIVSTEGSIKLHSLQALLDRLQSLVK